ncbi:hypothetical protein ABT247_20095 [Kitasatospora sp. NPDC001539]|uniref:hypothetical protein n=1 Tax=Kitasatospora sp. NPDC001539 TaxID=3154384 RepID=UPI00333215C6
METAQRVVKRSAWFARLPVALAGLSLLLLVHALVRKNLAHPTGVWEADLLDTQAAVAAVLASAGAVLARAQYARAVRPALGWFGRVMADVTPDGELAWACHVMNGAQDVAVLTEVDYWVRFTPTARAAGATDSTRWGTWHEAMAGLAAVGLEARVDFTLDLIGPGRPIPAQGLMFVGWFTEKAMAEIDDVFVRVRVTDRVGDTHERVLALLKGADRKPRSPGQPPF